MRKTKRVKLTWPWVAPDGTKHNQNDVVTPEVAVANMLVRGGRAVEVADTPKRDEKKGE